MPDPSAVRPLLLPKKIFTEEDVAELAEFLCGIDNDYVCKDCTDQAHNALSYLADAGRLLPASAEHREEEFTVEYVHPMDREYRRQRMEPCMRTLGEVVEYAAGLRTVGYTDVKLYRRSRAVAAGPWVEVDGSQPDAP